MIILGIIFVLSGTGAVIYFLLKPRPDPKQKATWAKGEFGDCDQPCGTGSQYRDVICKDNENKQVDDKFCPEDKPSTEQECNTQKCEWKQDSEFGECSDTTGYQVKDYTCPREPNFCGDKPEPMKKGCGKWTTGDYEAVCRDQKGMEYCAGKQYEQILCKYGDKQFGEDVCPGDKPTPKSKDCSLRSCSWKVGEWQATKP